MSEGESRSIRLSPYEEDLIRLIEERKAKLDEVQRNVGSRKDVEKLQADIQWLEERLASYQRGVSWFRTPRLKKAEGHGAH